MDDRLVLLLGVTGPTQVDTSFTHCHFFPPPVGSSLPGMMEANEVKMQPRSCVGVRGRGKKKKKKVNKK